MGEIKSTLDLIMERTKNLTMSEEEKRAYREKELAGRVKALVQRTLDGLMTRERFREGVAALQGESGNAPLLKRMVADELAGRIELGKGHEPCLALLKTVAGVDPGPLQTLVHNYEAKAALLRDKQGDVLRERLERRGISGSAVTANLEADPDWRRAMQSLQQELKTELRKSAEAVT